MTEIQLKEPPARPAHGRRPLMALDRRILEIAQAPMRPVEVARVLRDPSRGLEAYPNIATQRVAARLKALVARGLMVRLRPQGAPRNGPGTSLYRARTEGDAQADD